MKYQPLSWRTSPCRRPRSRRQTAFLLAGLVAAAGTASAQNGPALVRDINETPFGPNPFFLTMNGSVCYFQASTPATGAEIWRSDGTAAGTYLVKDINSGTNGSAPERLYAWNGALYFVGNTSSGYELFKSDGTAGATNILRDLSPVSGASSNPQSLCGTANYLFYQGLVRPNSSLNNGTELCVTDGTIVGTRMVKDINETVNGSSFPNYLTSAGGDLIYFRAQHPDYGSELWKSDGTEAGTVLVKDINPGTASSQASAQAIQNKMLFTGGQLFLIANDNVSGAEVWVSQGTDATTNLTLDIAPGATGSAPAELTALGSVAVFRADDGVHGSELWRTDGTAAGTWMIKDILPGSGGSTPRQFGLLGIDSPTPELLFLATTENDGVELWKTDGTPEGTVQVRDINPGPGDGVTARTVITPAAGGRSYFFAQDEAGLEPWVTDGTDAGTTRVADLNPGPGDSINSTNNASSFIAPFGSGGALLSAWSPANGMELWITDGTAAGTTVTRELISGNTSSNPRNFGSYNGRLYFAASGTDTGEELWTSDGTAEGTTMVVELYPQTLGISPKLLTECGGKLFFTASPYEEGIGPIGNELCITDGTAAGTTVVKELRFGMFDTGPVPQHLTDFNGTLLFSADAPYNVTNRGRELWKSDGTADGTVLVKDINPGASASSPDSFVVIGSTMYFAVRTQAATGAEVWKTDGTDAGTVIVKDLNPGTGGSAPFGLTKLGDKLLFGATVPGAGKELVITDGTDAGTMMIGNRNGATDSVGTVPPCVIGSTALFVSSGDSAAGAELWMTDGTDEGTGLLKDINPGTGASSIASLVAAEGRAFFVASNGTDGAELWISDGTPEGTSMVADLNPGPAGSSPTLLTPHGSRVVFKANDGTTGEELWVSDGTAAGTRRLSDLVPGSGSAGITEMKAAAGMLFLSAKADVGNSDNDFGQELYALPLTEVPVTLSTFDLE